MFRFNSAHVLILSVKGDVCKAVSFSCFLHIRDIFMSSCVSLYGPFNVYADQSRRGLLFFALCPQLLSTVSRSCQDPFLPYSHVLFLSGPSVPFERHRLSL